MIRPLPILLLLLSPFTSGRAQGTDTSPRAALLAKIEQLATLPFPEEGDKRELDLLLTEGQKEYPDDPEFLDWSAIRFDRLGETRQAEEIWRRAMKAKGKLVPPRLLVLHAKIAQRLGYLLLGQGKFAEAATLAQQSIAGAPNQILGYQLLADAALESGQLSELATQLAAAAEKKGPAQESIRWLYLDLLAKTGEWAKLKDQLQRTQDPSPPTGERHHFLALVAEQAVDRRAEVLHHWIAAENSSGAQRWGTESRLRLDRLLDPQGAPPQAVYPHADAIRLGRMPLDAESARELQSLVKNAKGADVSENLLLDHYRATAAEALDDHDPAIRTWTVLLRTSPGFVPALLGLAQAQESVEEIEIAEQLRAKAKSLKPDHPLVVEFYRLGGVFRTADAGVLVHQTIPGGPLDAAGIQPGDILLELDGEKLKDLEPKDRLRKTRQYLGGRIRYRATPGDEITTDIPLQLHDVGAK